MRCTAIVCATICGLALASAVPADETDPSCAELAERRAARQFSEEDAARENRQAGQVRDSALQRDLLRLGAESYRRKVYEDCLKRRGRPEARPEPAPADG